jgi:hypothetical protein
VRNQTVRDGLAFLLLGACLAGCGRKTAARAPSGQGEQSVNAVVALGGKVTQDDKLPGRPVIAVNLSGAKNADAALGHVKELKDLKTLNLYKSDASDVGMAHLGGLKALETLYLCGTRITDAGLKHLGPLKALRTLGLWGTRVTDAGLGDLKELKGLQTVWLNGTKVTGAGAKDLREALPNTKIHGP